MFAVVVDTEHKQVKPGQLFTDQSAAERQASYLADKWSRWGFLSTDILFEDPSKRKFFPYSPYGIIPWHVVKGIWVEEIPDKPQG